MQEKLVKMTGGNSSNVLTDGIDVYRELTQYSPTVHRVLSHYADKGIAFVPKFKGIVKQYEVLSFVPGATLESYPPDITWEERTEMIQSSAKILRVLHDATIDFVVLPTDTFYLQYVGVLPKEVLCHNDFAPYNVTFLDGRVSGIFDFDTVSPAPRIWDIAYAVYRFIPIARARTAHEELYVQVMSNTEMKQLITLFMNAYDYPYTATLFSVMIERLEALLKLIEIECQRGNKAFIQMQQDGHHHFYQAEIKYIQENWKYWL